MQPLPPELVQAFEGRYRLEGVFGRGGMATVYRAHDVRHDRVVALKVIDAGVGSGVDTRRFELEVRAAARLNHPHILPLFEADRVGRHLFYAMPAVAGATLADRIRSEGPLPRHEAVTTAIAVARALQHAHDEGIVHRDVKPGNILLHRGLPVVSDFGISGVLDQRTRLTIEGSSLGTPHYMSPEQIEGREPDGRTDQYGLACVLFEMLEGSPPFSGRSVRAVVTAHVVSDPPALSEAAGTELDRILRRALAKDVNDRFPTMEEFAGALEGVLSDRPGAEARGRDEPGLVVLPFANLSSDPDNEYFSDGLTEEVIADLSQIRELRVISRTSAMRLKQDPRELSAIARDLGVRYVLEGGVRKAGQALRITARLIDAPADAHLWTERFSGTMDEVFEIQEQVARSIVAALRVRLSPDEDEALAARPLPDPRAYEPYLRARYEAWRFTPESLERATRYIEAATAIVGDNVLLLGTLGHIRAMYVESGADPSPGALEGLEELVRQVFAIDPQSPRGHWLQAFLSFQRGEMAIALVAAKHARVADPADPDNLILSSYIHAHAGLMESARDFVERAVAIDPLTPLTRLLPGFVAVFDGRLDEGLEPYRRALDLDPESPFTATFYGWALAHAGRTDEAVGVLEEAARRPGPEPLGAWASALARGLSGDPVGARAAIVPAFEEAGRIPMFARALADCWAMAGDRARALHWLERAVELGLLNAPYVARHNVFLSSLHGDPGFADLVRRIERAAAALPSV